MIPHKLHIKICYGITHPCPHSNSDLTNSVLHLGYEYCFDILQKLWVYFFIHNLISNTLCLQKRPLRIVRCYFYISNLLDFTWLIRYFQTYDSPTCSSNMISDWVTTCILNGAFIWSGFWLHLVQLGPDLNAIYCVWQSRSVPECGIIEQTKPAMLLRDLCSKKANPTIKDHRFVDQDLSKTTLYNACNPICIFWNTVHLTI